MGGGHGYMGVWGNFGGPKQKGMAEYAISPLRQRAFAGALNGAIFNTFRRTKSQILYFAPPFIAGYYLYTWAGQRNEYLNSKAGHAEFGDH
ncbi:cytochrome b-c1 complex subunit 8 [Protomyces lactucae-debilis]|uniref:Cytochrome b-c1 complex subunit 8 n=1 Tax=Protomyces lactucae-debilis TaxID=2754530 RepID=A0A1Y2FMX9_PROLT|nr:cytochrome b-c1 complex subunit 8 [Protomyces lactucae-debilis]ORY84937.1 cytochrome b-c1 complex subunit 8 [Protomyces lactucae-debilis]